MPVRAITNATVSRLTVDLEQGTYMRLCSIVNQHNDKRDKGTPYLTKANLLRNLVGTWMQRVKP